MIQVVKAMPMTPLAQKTEWPRDSTDSTESSHADAFQDKDRVERKQPTNANTFRTRNQTRKKKSQGGGGEENFGSLFRANRVSSKVYTISFEVIKATSISAKEAHSYRALVQKRPGNESS